jgi:hypothetical protein
MVTYILTSTGVSLFVNGKPLNISQDHPKFLEIMEVVKSGELDAEERIQELVDVAMNAAKQEVVIEGVAIRDDGVVTLDGRPLDNSLTRRMVRMKAEGFDLKPMANFLVRLSKNPSYRARQELYTFLEVGQLPLTPDGCFLAYKVVRPDYKDYHSGTFDNSVGCVVSMPRYEVDDDSGHTCSAGLHFCSLDYLQHFGGRDGHVMILKVDPADVVSIPADYNNTKARCCRYEVVGEYTDYRRDHPLPAWDQSVVDDPEDGDDFEDSEEEETFSVMVFKTNTSLEAEAMDSGLSFFDALELGKRLKAAYDYYRVLVVNEADEEEVTEV